ncbi:MAG: hypothetical protein QW220_05370 [Candidatus Bathyarchaeia archaeon]
MTEIRQVCKEWANAYGNIIKLIHCMGKLVCRGGPSETVKKKTADVDMKKSVRLRKRRKNDMKVKREDLIPYPIE